MITKARIWIMVASLMLTMCFAINNSTSAKAAVVTEVATQNLKLNNAINEAKNEYEGDVIGVGTIELGSVTLSSNSYQVASTKSIAENGNIFGNGVRLRKLPKKTATILELMYNRERVCINYTKSAKESNGKWYYVKRVKTGTWGWVNYNYLCHWD